MTKVKPTTKEQLIFYLISNISLGTYDRRFLVNIEDSNLVLKKPLTSNQVKLLDKIITRYHRQLLKLELNSTELLTLPWATPPIDSLPQYTEVYLDLIDDTLVLRSPYKKEFINEFKKNEINAKWDSESRFWYMPASTHNIKVVNQQITKHYSKINYCELITEFLNTVKEYDNCKYWNPTYKVINNNYMIVATNRWLNEALNNIVLDDDLKTISKLVSSGVTIDKSVIESCKNKYDPVLVDFAVNLNPDTEITDLSVLIEKLKITGVDFVFIYYKLSRGNLVKQLTETLKSNDIDYHVYDNNEVVIFPESTYKNPVMISDRSINNQEKGIAKKFAKIIKAVNSKPIIIK